MSTNITNAEETKTAVFAGGCFWCMQKPFDTTEGVIDTKVGYTGGDISTANYKATSAGETGHAEAIEVTYDPSKVSYEQLLDIFWVNVDPTVKDRQFCDVGSQYRSAIFPAGDEEKAAAEASRQRVKAQLGTTIHTSIEPFDKFYDGEEYHQDYYLKNPIRYKFYRYNCGRDQRLNQIWGDAS